MFAINYFTRFFEKLLSLSCYVFDRNSRDSTFSTDVYVELAEEDQHHEYMALNLAIKHAEYRLLKGDADDPALYEYFL